MDSAWRLLKDPPGVDLSRIDAILLVFNAEVMMTKCSSLIFVEESIFIETHHYHHKQSDAAGSAVCESFAGCPATVSSNQSLRRVETIFT